MVAEKAKPMKKHMSNKTVGFSNKTVGFANSVKPYFTPCYRAHMMRFGNQFDLWDPAAVKVEFDAIQQQVTSKDMPQAGCPEGVWDDMTRERFLSDFAAWKDAGFLP